MTGRREHHERHGDPSSGAARPDRIDPWDALGPDDPTPSANVADEFWGDLPDWSATASTSRRSARRRIGARDDEPVDPTPIGAPSPTERRGGIVESIRGAWDGLLGGSADATREHRRLDVTPTPAPSPVAASPVDAWDDDWDDWGDLDDGFGDDRPIDVASLSSSESPTEDRDESPVAGLERGWMAEAAVSRERRPGIDPLLARLGAIVVVACLVVPLLIAATRSNDAIDGSSGVIASASTIEQTELAADTVPSTAPTTDSPAIEPLDPASLPPAVPVNTEPQTSGGVATSDRPDVDDVVSDVVSDTAATSTASTAPTTSRSESERSTSAVPEVDEPAAADDPAARVDPPACPISYTVVAGDFWIRLADAAAVELADLLEVNRATVDTPLFVGSEICLPAGASTPAPPTTTPPTTTPPTTAPPTTAPPTTAPPTTAPPTTAAPTTAPREEPPGPEDIKQIVRDVWPDELEERALEIVYIESRFVPTAKNFCCYGLFQIYWEVHDVWLVDLGITSATQLYDPETNARAALALYERAGGWGPWGF